MKEVGGNDRELRLDVRTKNGIITRLSFMQRCGKDKFSPVEGDFTKDHVQGVRLLLKAATAAAKRIAPPFDVKAIVSEVNKPTRRKKRIGPKPGGKKRTGM